MPSHALAAHGRAGGARRQLPTRRAPNLSRARLHRATRAHTRSTRRPRDARAAPIAHATPPSHARTYTQHATPIGRPRRAYLDRSNKSDSPNRHAVVHQR
jgi:hypothetical protein